VKSLAEIAEGYVTKYGDSVKSGDRLRELDSHYARRRESTLLDAAAAAVAVDALVLSDEIDLDAVTPQLLEAFERAYPGRQIADELSRLKELDPESAEVTGYLSNWKGVYHEVLIRDRLNDGQQVGSVVLGEGQSAVLADDLNQRGFDLQILNGDASVAEFLQAKATSEAGLITDALRAYPAIQIAATEEAAGAVVDERVFASGFSNEDLLNKVVAPMEEAWDSGGQELAETVLPGLPFVLILTSEGAAVLMGKATFKEAAGRAMDRSLKTGASVAAGTVASLAGAGLFSLPVALLTRAGIDRTRLLGQLEAKIRSDRLEIAALTLPDLSPGTTAAADLPGPRPAG
jgi:hypothetical protein